MGDAPDIIDFRLADLRDRLLNLTKSNKLLDTKFGDRSRAHFRVIDVQPNPIYTTVVQQELEFEGLPPLETEPPDERTPAFLAALDEALVNDEVYVAEAMRLEEEGAEDAEEVQQRLLRELKDRVRERLQLPPRQVGSDVSLAEHARAFGIEPSFDLAARAGDGDPSDALRLLMLPDTMERKLAGLHYLARTYEQETGINTLYLAFGFLEWRESPQSDRKLYAPLMLVSARLRRSVSGGAYVYRIKAADEDAQDNVTLRELLARDFRLNLPAIKDNETPEEYWRRVDEDIVSKQPQWRVRRWVAVGTFPFARIAMYYDLSNDDGVVTREDLVRAMLSGAAKDSSIAPAEEKELDTKEVEEAPILITDADSSQHCAVLDVFRGRNLVVKGPPGTGKSQTITNIIGAALDRGETVLFVAEKLTALEVVYKRLKQAALDRFCLRLHSDKASRKDVAYSFNQRLEHEPVTQPSTIDTKIEQLRRHKERLNDYVQRVNAIYGKSGVTVRHILGDARRLDEIASLPSALTRLQLADPADISPRDLDQAETQLRALEGAYSVCVFDGVTLATHPWRGLQKIMLTPYDLDRIVDDARRWELAAAAAMATAQTLKDADARLDTSSPTAVKSVLTMLDNVVEVTRRLPPRPLAALLDREKRREVELFVADLEQYQNAVKILVDAGVHAVDSDTLERLHSGARQLGVLSAQLGEISDLVEEKNRSALLLGHMLRPINDASEIVGVDGELSLADVGDLLEAAAMIREADAGILTARHPAISVPEALELLDEAAQVAASLMAQRGELSDHLHLDVDVRPDDLEMHATIIENAGALAFLSSRVRVANRCYERVSRSPTKINRRERARNLRRLAAHLRAIAKFESDRRYERIAGHLFFGIETDFGRLRVAAIFISSAKQRFTRSRGIHADLRRFLIEREAEALVTLTRVVAECPREHLWSRIADPSLGLNQALGALRAEVTALSQLADGVKSLGSPRHTIRLCDLSELAQLCRHVAEKGQELTRRAQVIALPDEMLNGLDTDTGVLNAALAIAKVAAEFAEPARSLALEGLQTVERLRDLALSAMKASDTAVRAFSTMAANDIIDCVAFFDGADANDVPFIQAAARSNVCGAGRESLLAWANWQRRIRDITAPEIKDFVETGLTAGITPATLTATYRTYIRRNQAQDVCRHDPILLEMNGADQENSRQKFRQIDVEIQGLQRQRLVARLLARRVPNGIGSGRAADYTDLALIRNEATKQKRHIPVRQLLSRAREAALALTPCFMMSPLSVAQYLKRSEFKFDLLVVDEASQMPPEDAIGALARAHRAVVMGDDQQLAPTDFFTRSTIKDDVAEGLEDERIVHESLLDRALAVFHPYRELRWHYRSRHPSLIAFSNRRFYEDKLIVFPAAADNDPELGVQLNQVEGLYGGQINPEEASVVVAAALEFMRERPNESLGIVTINQPQQELVREELDRLAARDSATTAYIKRWQTERDGLEPLFVKNLERVQGDERDVIFISTVYGPAKAAGVVAQHFGPINGAAGHRRLNVLFSRAKRQVKVFTSMRPADVRPDHQSRHGVHVLKDYLEYAATGRLDPGRRTETPPESPFEEMVIDRIRALGFEAVPQVGVKHFRVDIGVKHSDYPYGYLLGIECDGATYHSAATARDRDRLRQEVLEDLGWRLYRIWSTDWFRDPAGESDRLRRSLLSRLEDAVANMPQPRSPQRPSAQVLPLPLAEPRREGHVDRATIAVPVPPTASPRTQGREPGVEVQDSVVYAFKSTPERRITITITHRTHDPDRGYLAKGHPLVQELLGAKEGDEVLVSIGGAKKSIIVLEVIKPGQEKTEAAS